MLCGWRNGSINSSEKICAYCVQLYMIRVTYIQLNELNLENDYLQEKVGAVAGLPDDGCLHGHHQQHEGEGEEDRL